MKERNLWWYQLRLIFIYGREYVYYHVMLFDHVELYFRSRIPFSTFLT